MFWDKKGQSKTNAKIVLTNKTSYNLIQEWISILFNFFVFSVYKLWTTRNWPKVARNITYGPFFENQFCSPNFLFSTFCILNF